jgi:uncharacterized coiled-coil protein SlyX
VTEQDKAMLAMAGEIDQLKKKFLELSQGPDAEPGSPPVIDERPPHY